MVGEAIGKFGLKAIKEIPGASLGIELLGEENIVKKAGELASFVSKKLNNKDETKLVLNPIEVLTPLFVDDLNELSEKKHIVIAFDTFEFTRQFIEDWILKIIEGYYGELHPNYTIIISGRNKMSSSWSHLWSICEFFELEPFSIKEATDYLFSKGIKQTKIIDKIIQLSNGLPLWLSTLASQSIQDEKEILDPTNLAIERFLKWDTDKDYKWAAIKCSVPRSLNKDILEAILPDQQIHEIYDWLKKQPFVKQNSEKGWSYHQIVRKIMIKHLRDESENEWRQLNGKLVEYFKKTDSNIKAESNNNNYLNIIFHAIITNLENSKILLFDSFLNALITSDEIANQILLIVEEASDLANSTELKIIRQKFINSIEDYYYGNSDNYGEFIAFLDEIENTLKHNFTGHAKLLVVRGKIYNRIEEYKKALKDINLAIELNPDEGYFYIERAKIYSNQKEYESSIRDLKIAILKSPEKSEILEEIAEIYSYKLNDLHNALIYASKNIEYNSNDADRYELRSSIYRNFKEFNKSLQDISRAIELKPNNTRFLHVRARLYEQLKRNQEALQDYDTVIKIEPEYDYHYGRRAKFYINVNNIENAIRDYSLAIELKPGRKKRASKSIGKRLKIGTKVMYIGNSNWYEMRGDLFMNKKEYDQAITDFQQELIDEDIERKGILNFKIGEAFREKGDKKNANKYFQEATMVSADHYFEHKEEVITTKGHSYMALGAYREAIEVYTLLCKIDPENVNYIFWKCSAEYNCNQFELALQSIDLVIDKYEASPTFVYLLKLRILRKLLIKEAILQYAQQIVTKFPNDLFICLSYISCQIEFDSFTKYAKELNELKQSILLQYNNRESQPVIFLCLAGINSLEGNVEESLELLDKYVSTADLTINNFFEDDFIWDNIKNIDAFKKIVQKI